MSKDRNKAAVEKAGMSVAHLRKLHAIRSNREKQLIRSLESIENFWDEVSRKNRK